MPSASIFRGGSLWWAKCAPSASRNSEVETPINERAVTPERSLLGQTSYESAPAQPPGA
jgi:hypothetical protein